VVKAAVVTVHFAGHFIFRAPPVRGCTSPNNGCARIAFSSQLSRTCALFLYANHHVPYAHPSPTCPPQEAAGPLALYQNLESHVPFAEPLLILRSLSLSSLDVEDHDRVGMILAPEDGNAVYLPVKHEGQYVFPTTICCI
jgi:hypothetical protein